MATTSLIPPPNPVSFLSPNKDKIPSPISLIPKCNSIKELKQIQAYIIKSNLQHQLRILAKLINVCTVNPSSTMGYAQQLFDQIPNPNIILFNTMARGYARTYTPLLALSLFVNILHMGVDPDDYTFPSLLKACASAKALEEGKQLHSFLIKFGLHHNIYVLPTLINMYTECREVTAARRVFDQIVDPCVVIYNAMIVGYARDNRPNEALGLFRQLQLKDLKPTDVTMLSVLASCASLGALDLGKWIHEYVKNNGFAEYVKVNTALIDMYAKCGSLEDAVCVFCNMSFRDTQAWSAMIICYATHGCSDKALLLFEEMKNAGVRPDEISFLGVLYACSHTGKVDEGWKYFYSMKDTYGIVPRNKHYGCMVDLLGRARRLDEAYKFIEGLPVKPTPILWRTLLSACYSHGDVEMGQLVMEQIVKLDESHGGDYVILSNLCARAGRLEDANHVRKLMKEKGVMKVPGCSAIEVNSVVHEFFSGDGTHPESQELRRVVDDLVEKLKLVGYVPDTSIVFHVGMEEREKEQTLKYHSEKLAIAYGLINTPPGTTIRVIKNIRVCVDCHSAAKFVSKFSNRMIILRDIQRFHHFKDGVCSCGDYW